MIREREHGGHWMNQSPITELPKALVLLAEKWGDSGPRYLSNERGPYEICVAWYRDGDSGGDTNGINHYEIDQNLAKELLEKQYVKKRTQPRIGHTHTYDDQFVLTRAGKDELERLDKLDEQKADEILAASLYAIGPVRFRKNGSGGSVDAGKYFDYTAPNGEQIRITIRDGKIEKLPNEEGRRRYNFNGSVETEVEILKLLKGSRREIAYLSDPDTIRIDVHSDGIHIESQYYKVDPTAIVLLLSERLLEAVARTQTHQPITRLRYFLSRKGEEKLRKLEAAAPAV